MNEGLIIGALIAGVWEVIGHYFRWYMFLGHDLGRIPSYIWGVMGIILGVATWAWYTGQWLGLLAVTVCSVGAGAFTIGTYGIDRLGQIIHERRTRSEIEETNDDTE